MEVMPGKALDDAGEEAAAADRANEHVWDITDINEFVDEGRVTLPQIGMIEGVDVDGIFRFCQMIGGLVGGIPGGTRLDDISAEFAHPGDSCLGDVCEGKDRNGNAKPATRVGRGDTSIAARRGNKTACTSCGCKAAKATYTSDLK